MSTTTRVGLQVQDDPALLDLMLEDLHEGPELYQPGNYWANYEKLLVPRAAHHRAPGFPPPARQHRQYLRGRGL